MTEMGKTMTYAATALIALVVAFIAKPRVVEFTPDKIVGKELDPFEIDAPKRLSIWQFDESKSALSEFEVAQVNGEWSIPSKDGYPTDARTQMADAAKCINHLTVLGVASDDAAQHEMLGVVDPISPNLTAGAQGVGTHVKLEDEGETLIDLIIGDEVKGADGQHYVRRASQDVTYVVEIDPAALSTEFEDWIEKDLLKLNAWDIRDVHIRDYSLQHVLTLQGRAVVPERKGELLLSYDDKDSKWLADAIRVFDEAQKDYRDEPLADDEELDTSKLNDMKNALGDLKIVDVERKPKGLSTDLKASEEFVTSEEAFNSLASRGFMATRDPDSKELDILSTDGEVICTMKNGVEYVLRFGDFQLSGGTDGGAPPAEGAEPEIKRDDIHRYLFVMSRFNEDAVEKPDLEDLPDLPEGVNEADLEKAETEATEKTEEADKSDGEADASDGATDAEPSDAGDAEEEETDEETTEEATEKTDETTENDAETEGDASDGEASELEKILEERKTIRTENDRKEDEYQEKIKEGREKVQELNDRFGDWYYVIDDEVYQKIHLGREDIVKKKEKDEKDEADAEPNDGEKAPVDAAGFGKPGESVPGLPDVPGVLEEEE